MHPGGENEPGDPNAAFFLNGHYHLHYVLRHPRKGGRSYCYIHLTSPVMLHWSWQRTKLQPSFTGHGMFSGTGFHTKEGRSAIIYHGQGVGQNFLTLSRNATLSDWEPPYPVLVTDTEGKEDSIENAWDPDLFSSRMRTAAVST